MEPQCRRRCADETVVWFHAYIVGSNLQDKKEVEKGRRKVSISLGILLKN